jgi:CheY-like chemotaxis protein
MAPEVLERAFEPYFTTKGPDRGTGLGLAVVHGAVVDAGGTVQVEQPPDGGTLVVLELPALAEPNPGRASGADDDPLTVLVVDDDPDALRSVARLLETCGFRVVVTTSGAEALARLRDADDPAEVDVVLTDVVMPHMSGPVLAAELRALRPTLPVVLMTAYGADLLVDVDAPVLSKPLLPEEVDRVLRAAAGLTPPVPGGRRG